MIGGTAKLEQPLLGLHESLLSLGETVVGKLRLVLVARLCDVVVAFANGASAGRGPRFA